MVCMIFSDMFQNLAKFGLVLASSCVCVAAFAAHQKAVITKQEIQLDSSHRIWIYRPKNIKGRCPLVLIAPAGTPLYHGMNLGDGDVPEFTPYAKAGCVVVAYDVSGPVPEGSRVSSGAIRAFVESNFGIKDAQRAIGYALKSIPEVDPRRVIVAGHSSAATLALQVAAADARVKACVAYAPVTDVNARLADIATQVERVAPGFTAKLSRFSPSNRRNRISLPLFLFHANDDDNVPAASVRQFAAWNRAAKLVEVPSGGHYNSMIQVGIPSAIRWLRQQGLIDR